MKWRLSFHKEVEDEVSQAAQWYELQQPGLGDRLLDAIQAVVNELAENPFVNAERHPRLRIRVRLTSRFPYRVIYRIDEASRAVLVVSVLHAKRDDEHWRKRV